MHERAESRSAWPELDWPAWQATAETLQLWTQIVGKTRLALTPLQNHWWNIPLYVSVRGLTTSPMPVDGGLLEIEFDFQAHVLHLRKSSGEGAEVALAPQSVASFFKRYRAALELLDVPVELWTEPVEIASPIRFELDEQHASYDREAVQRFHAVLMRVDTLLRRFATGFTGKISPVHFFWGSFDLCCTRFNGRRASGAPKADPVQQEAYSHEVISAGFWPGNGGFGAAAFYCYAAPVPAGLSERTIAPGAWDGKLGEFLLLYEDVRAAEDPDRAVLDFLESSYAAAAECAGWDRAELERPMSPVVA